MKAWSRTTRYTTFFLCLAAVLWFLWAIQELIGPIVISCLLAYLLNPIVSYVNSISKLPRLWVISIVYILIVTLTTIAGFTLIPSAIEQTEFLTNEFNQVLQELESTVEGFVTSFGLNLDVQEFFNSIGGLFSTGFSVDQLFAVLTATSRNFVWVLIVIVLTFYLLKDWHLLRDWLLAQAPPGYESDTRRLYGEIRDVWQAYLWGQLLLMTVIGVLSGLGSAAIGLQGSAVLLGVVAGVLDLIPSAGPLIAMGIATMIAWFNGAPAYLPVSNVIYSVIVLGIFTVIQLVENVWLRPRIMGQSLSLHPALVFVGVMGGLAIGGIVVGLLIVPLLGTVGIIGAYLRARMFGLDPWGIEDGTRGVTIVGTADVNTDQMEEVVDVMEELTDEDNSPNA